MPRTVSAVLVKGPRHFSGREDFVDYSLPWQFSSFECIEGKQEHPPWWSENKGGGVEVKRESKVSVILILPFHTRYCRWNQQRFGRHAWGVLILGTSEKPHQKPSLSLGCYWREPLTGCCWSGKKTLQAEQVKKCRQKWMAVLAGQQASTASSMR